MADQKQMTEQESLDLITNMIQKAKGSYHETGIGSLLWGTVVTLASVITYFERTYDFYIGFDIGSYYSSNRDFHTRKEIQ